MSTLPIDNNNQKIHLYQIFTRLYGNKKTSNKPWGTAEENGIGKFSDINESALTAIKELGMTHVWYTGVPHHALVRDYTEFGISNDHPAVVKGRAGSPYAVKDYYSVNPDLADNPANRNEEFRELIQRTHEAGLNVIIDIVPNHVARQYQGLNNPLGVADFGAEDDTSLEYSRENNFYYIPNQGFELPDIPDHLAPLGGEPHPLLATSYLEYPAKWTGNGSRSAKPNVDDWYETVKVNYGVRPMAQRIFRNYQSVIEAKMHSNTPTFGMPKMYLALGENFEILHCTGWSKVLTGFAMIWPKWCLSSFGAFLTHPSK